MKKALLILIFSFAILKAGAQELRHTVSFGAGFPNLPRLLFNTFTSKDDYQSTGTGPYHLKYEYRVNRWFGGVISINHMTYSVAYKEKHLDTALGRIVPNNIKISSNSTSINLRGNLHLINPENHEKTDLYLGLGLGYRAGKQIVSADYQDNVPSIDLGSLYRLGFETTLGFRYFFDDNLGIYTELGYAKSILQFGFSGRF
jgi:Outer membrane protein beta-barrel domain